MTPLARLRAHPWLVVVCAATAAGEAALVAWLGPHDAVALAPQVSAPEPFGILHDLRWLAVFHRSWLGFGLETGAFLLFRTGLVVLLVRLAWSGPGPPPRLSALVPMVGRFVVAVAVLGAVWIGVLFGMAVVSLEWLFLVGVPAVLVLAVTTHHGVLRSWWREAPPWRTAAAMALVFVMLSAAGALATVGPAVLAPVVALGAGVLDAWAWIAIVDHLAAVRPARLRPVAPAALAALVAASLVGVAVLGGHFGETTIGRQRATGTGAVMTAAARSPGPAVLVATGFNSSWDGSADVAVGPGVTQARFSYRGQDRAGGPLPYGAGATHRSLGALVRTMARQVEHLQSTSGRPVSLVAESEGALVAVAYLAAHPHAPVVRVVLLSPLLHPARVYYPPEGREGWGVATGYLLRGVTAVVDGVSSIDLPADSPLLRSIVDHASVLRDLLACTPGEIPSLVLLPVSDALSGPDEPGVAAPSAVLPAVHGGMLGNPQARSAVVRFLSGRPVRDDDAWRATGDAIRLAGAAWQVPELPLSVNPAWQRGGGSSHCAAVAAAARRWLGPS